MTDDEEQHHLALAAAEAVAAAIGAAGGRPGVLWVAGTMLLGIASERLVATPSRRDALLMLGEQVAREAADRLAGGRKPECPGRAN